MNTLFQLKSLESKIFQLKNVEEAREYLMNNCLVTSLLDTDFYKFTMQQVAFFHLKGKKAKFTFKNRNKIALARYIDIVNKQFDMLCELTFTKEEIVYLSTLVKNGKRLLKDEYLDALSKLKLKRESIVVSADKDGVTLHIDIAEDEWFENILFEIYVLSIVNGVHSVMEACANGGMHKFVSQGMERLDTKIEFAKKQRNLEFFKMIDMGTRRRFANIEYQLMCYERMKNALPNNLVGSSNVYIAYKHGFVPSGTMAHEFLQAMQAIVGIRESQGYAFNLWKEQYGKDLQIALSDIFGMNPFFVVFNKELAEHYEGARHDSGDPFEWGDKLIKHYNHFGINAQEKTGVFSDGLNFEKAFKLLDHFLGKINTVYGIGTNFTNDTGLEALQIVLKMVMFDGKSVAKRSDDPAKGMCQDIAYNLKVSEVAEEMNKEYERLYEEVFV